MFRNGVRWIVIACLVTGCLVSPGANAAEPDAVPVEKTLRAQGLVPGKQPPAEQGDWAYAVRGTAEKPEFEEWECYPFTEGRTSFGGKRFSYHANNRGEWGGEFTVREGNGKARTLIRENVVDIVPTAFDELLVFTGLDHGSMDHGAVYAIERYDEKPRLRFISLLPGTPRAVIDDPHRGGTLVLTRLSLSVVRTHMDRIEVLMARHAPLPDANSVLSISRSEILVGICGGIAHVRLPIRGRDQDADYPIPIVTYWTRQ